MNSDEKIFNLFKGRLTKHFENKSTGNNFSQDRENYLISYPKYYYIVL